MRIIIKKRVEFEMKMFHLAACSLGWLMRSLRPQKCNLISSVNLDRKWPKQNWFSLLHISCQCHRPTAEACHLWDYNCREFVLIGYRGSEMREWLFRIYVLLLWSNCRDDDRGFFLVQSESDLKVINSSWTFIQYGQWKWSLFLPKS